MKVRIVLDEVPERFAGTIASEIAALLESIYVPLDVRVSDTAGWSEEQLAEIRAASPPTVRLRVERG